MRVIPWLLIVAGVVLVYVGTHGAVTTFMSALTPTAEWQTPAVQKVTLTAGKWTVFQKVTSSTRTPSQRPSPKLGATGTPIQPISWPQRASGSGLLAAEDVSVFGPTGARIATTCVYCVGSETMHVSGGRYEGIVRFTAETDGEYTIATEIPDVSLAIAPPALETVSRTFISVAWLGLGIVLIASGVVWLLILLILYLVRSGSSVRAQPTSPAGASSEGGWSPPNGPPVG